MPEIDESPKILEVSERITAVYLLETALEMERAISAFAAEGSTGTFVAIPDETAAVRERLGIRVEEVEPLEDGARAHLIGARGWTGSERIRRARVTLSVPLELTGCDLATIGASLLGNVFELAELSGIRLEEVHFPEGLLRAASLPAHGVGGTRELLGVRDRPIFGTIVRTGRGAGATATAAQIAPLLEAGIDFLKDDELLADAPGNPLEQRIDAVMRVLEEAADRSGRRAMFAFNITDDLDQMLRHQERIAAAGGNCVQVNIQHAGSTAVAELRRRGHMVIHAHRAGWGLQGRGVGVGISAAAHASLWRLVGVDHLIVNGFRGKFWEPRESVLGAVESCLSPLLGAADRTLPAIAAGQWGGQVPETFAEIGNPDWLYLVGAAVAEHPNGPAAGVRALHRAWEASVAGESLVAAARRAPELAASITAFGGGEER
jgi:ribulose-bisphosphate carboxylase large chain